MSVFLSGLPTPALDRDRTIHQFYHTAWTAKDGAPSQITALTQTEDGYLWIESSLGLYRFDGVKFEQFSPQNQTKLPSYNIYALLATPDNGLCISFRPSGLGFLKDGQLKVFTKPESFRQRRFIVLQELLTAASGRELTTSSRNLTVRDGLK